MVKLGIFLRRFYVGVVFFLLYSPILVMAASSFNRSKARTAWGGFTLGWYVRLFHNETVLEALRTSLLLTTAAALLATVLGTLACVGMSAMGRRSQAIILNVTNIPMLNADIVTGIAAMLLFVRFMRLGFASMLIAHVTLGIPYVILNVMPRLRQPSSSVYEAALDLGASPAYAFRRVVLPELMPGIFSGFMLAFTISLDDFIITYFTKGAGVNTISTVLYQELRRGISPEMYAMSTLLFLVILLVLLAVNRISARQPGKEGGYEI